MNANTSSGTGTSNSPKEPNTGNTSFNTGTDSINYGNFSGNLFDIWQGQLSRKDQNQKQLKDRKAAISELIKPVNSTKFLRHH